MCTLLRLAFVLWVVTTGCGDDGGNTPVDATTADIDAPATGPARVAPYINRDTGMPTENSDVDAGSSCTTPDVMDTQSLSTSMTTDRNVHIDACLFAASGTTPLDGQATFESSGVGFISACPDPDAIMGGADGPRTSVATDTSGDGKNDRCVQSGYQQKGSAGDLEFHARMNNDTSAGQQIVVFCIDANGNGCDDETIKQTITIDWVE